MQIDHLRYFIALEQYGSINKTSQEMNTAPQNLSRVIKRMEDEFGGELIVRSPNGVSFTVMGKEFLNFAKGTVFAYDLLVEKNKRLQSSQRTNQKITIFSQNNVNECVLNDIILAFHRDYPEITVLNILCDYKNGYKRLQAQPEAIGMLLCNDEDYINETMLEDFQVLPFMRARFVLLMNKNHPLSSYKEISVREVAGQSIVMLVNDSFDETEIPEILDKYDLNGRVSITSIGNISTCYRMIAENNCVCPSTREAFLKQPLSIRKNIVAVPFIDDVYAKYAILKSKHLPPDSPQHLFFSYALSYMQRKEP